MGRKKIVIQRIEKKAARDICFSKRRQGLFCKANELAVMCGAEVAAVVYSRAGKAYSFGHPSAEDIVDRFLHPAEQAGAAGAGMGAAVDPDRLGELQQKYNKLGADLDTVEQRKEHWGEAIAKGRAEGSQAAAWLDAVADQRDMGDADMLACMATLREAQVTVAALVNQVLQDGRRDKEAALAPLPPQLLAGGGGFELGGTSVNGGMGAGQMMAVMPTPGFAVGGGFELGGTNANGGMEVMMTAIAGGGGLVLGGTNANGWMEEQYMMMAMPQLPWLAGGGGFEFGGTSVDGPMYEMMTAVPPPPVFAAGMEMMQQQQQQKQLMSAVPAPPGLAAGMEMQQQQTLTALPPLPVFASGTEMMTSIPPAPGFTAGMHQESGPYVPQLPQVRRNHGQSD